MTEPMFPCWCSRCGEVAFRSTVEPAPGRPIFAEHCRLLDGSTPANGDPIVCGSCGLPTRPLSHRAAGWER